MRCLCVFALMLTSLIVGGCQGDLMAEIPGDMVVDPPPARDSVRLEVVGPDSQRMEHGTELEVSFRLVDSANDAPVQNQAISLAIVGEASGSSLALPTIATDAFGVASGLLRAGTEDATFIVEATHPSAPAPARISVRVAPGAFAKVDYLVTYAIEEEDDHRGLLKATVGAFPDTNCAELLEMSMDGSTELRPHSVNDTEINDGQLETRGELERVLRGETYAYLAVLTDLNEVIAGYGCEQATVLDPTGEVEIEVINTRYQTAGEYDTIEIGNLTEGLPGWLQTVLDVAETLRDPGEAIVDFIRDTLGINISATVGALLGDAADFVFRQFLSSTPWGRVIDAILEIGVQLKAAFDHFELRSTYELTEIDAAGEGTGVRTLHAYVGANYGGSPFETELMGTADFDYSVEPDGTVLIDEHEVPVSFGRVIGSFVDGLLDSFASDLGVDRLCDERHTAVVSLNRRACNALDGVVDRLLEDLTDGLGDLVYDTLYLDDAGPFQTRPYEYYFVDEEDGVVNGRWVRGSSTLPFSGTYTMLRAASDRHWLDPVNEALMNPVPAEAPEDEPLPPADPPPAEDPEDPDAPQ